MSQVDEFLNRFNRVSNYKDGDTKLTVGNTITIQDGTYNAIWVIAGFDAEHNQTAADGTVYDNGYGIALIPKTYVTTSVWNSWNGIDGAYKNSYIHNNALPAVVTKLKDVLGDHIINRNVLLSNSISNYSSSSYVWTTSYATLMSIGQMTGTFAKHNNKYDDGEANYRLPLFNQTGYIVNADLWVRNVWGRYNDYNAWFVNGNGSFSRYQVNTGRFGLRPVICIR